MKVWKRNAVVAAIVLFVCAAVYLNWTYQGQESADAGKTLGQAALVSGQTSDPLLQGAASPAPSASASPTASSGRTPCPSAGPGQRTSYSAGRGVR